MTIELKKLDDHKANFKLIMNSLKSFIQKNGQNKNIIDNFDNFFDANKILEKDENTLLNFAKLLLFITSLSSKKDKHLSILTSIDNNFQNEFVLSCQFFQVKNIKVTGNNKAKDKNNNNENNVQVNEISFFLSGGDFLQKKIDILDETIIKNSEMYNSILDKQEKQMAELKQSKIELENANDQKDAEIEQLKKKLEEFNSLLNKKAEENSQIQKELDNTKEQKEKSINELQKQIKDITDLKDQEITMLNNKIKAEQNNNNEKNTILEQDFEKYKITSSKMNQELKEQNDELKKQVNDIPILRQEIEKLKYYCNESEIEKQKLKNDILVYQQKLQNGENINREMSEKINFLEQKLNSDPYYARDIMSKTLYDFALKLMSENN